MKLTANTWTLLADYWTQFRESVEKIAGNKGLSPETKKPLSGILGGGFFRFVRNAQKSGPIWLKILAPFFANLSPLFCLL